MKFRYWIFIILFSLNGLGAQNPLKIYCIDVNQGDATLIISPTNKYVLIDAGDAASNYGDTVFRFIRNLGITHLDHTIATHYHADHIGGFPTVICSLSRGPNRNDSILGFCYDRGDSNPHLTQMYYNYIRVCTLNNKRKVIGLGETLNLGGGAFMVCVARNGRVTNGTGVTPNEENDRSIAFVLKYGHFEFFIGGDLSGSNDGGYRDVETKVAPVVRNIDLLRINHHGSKYSSNSTFLDSLQSEVSIISLGNNNYGYPFQEVIDRLVARNSYIYQLNDNSLGGGIIPVGKGRILNTTATITVNNLYYTVNGDTYPIDGVIRDGTVLDIISPKDTITEGTLITPKAKIKNIGNVTESFKVRFKIGSVYNKTKTITGLAPNDTITISFDTTWLALRGNYQVSCSTEVPTDINKTNDKKSANLTVILNGWQKKLDITSPIAVKDGGALVTAEGTIYALIGNNSRYFYRYNPDSNTWQNRKDMPYGYYNGELKTKAVKKGSALTFGEDSSGNKVIYALKGNNTREFWKYWVEQDSWIQLIDILNHSIKGGSSIAYAGLNPDSKYVFVLKGMDKSFDFRAYNIITGQWDVKRNAPAGEDSKTFKDGSCIITVRDSLYAIKGGAKYNEFYCYDIRRDTWFKLNSIPEIHPDIRRNKKIKAGGSLTFDANTNIIYAIKGGGTQEFWCYDITTNNWTPKETIPKDPPSNTHSVIKAGGSLTALSGTIYALKGNKTKEFWQYTPAATDETKNINGISNISNQSQSDATFNHNQFDNVTITIYNVAGQVIKKENIPSLFSFDKLNFSPGVYFIYITPKDHNPLKFKKKIIVPH